MGQYSWFTQDDNHRIVNGENRTVYMTDNKGNSYREDCYQGYGVFGGKDYFELLAEMNGLGSDRQAGINLAYSRNQTGQNPNCLHPSLTSHEGWYCGGKAPEYDPHDGVSYLDDDDECSKEDWSDAGA